LIVLRSHFITFLEFLIKKAPNITFLCQTIMKYTAKEAEESNRTSSIINPQCGDNFESAVHVDSGRETAFPFGLEFDKPDDVVYFNNSGKTPLPVSVQRAGQTALQKEAQPWNLGDECTDDIRLLFSQIVHCSSNDIAIVPSTGFAMTLVAQNIFRSVILDHRGLNSICNPEQKLKVLILQDEMSSEVYAWQQFGDQVEFVIVPHPLSDTGWTQPIIDELQNGEVTVCCVPQVHWSDGSYIDLKLVGHYCKLYGVFFVVDGTQSVGIMPMNVKEIQCDALACSVHKWLLGPHGMSLLYIHPDHHDTWMPLDQHERSREVFQNEAYDASENNIGKEGYPSEFLNDGAGRCDSGGKKNPILQPMVCEGLKIVNSLDLIQAQCHLKCITDLVLEGAKKLGLGVQPGPRAGHIIGLRPMSSNLVKFLTPERMVRIVHKLSKEKNVYFAARSGAFRISPYLNTTKKDVQILLESLEEELG
jgi:selenocysteine lyase/cysteine desulfurase